MKLDQALSSHPLARKFPHLKGAEFDELVADIKTHGLREPITRFEGKILDGWNRCRACLRLKLEPRFEEFEGDAAAALAFVISKNIIRRHLKPKDKRDAIAALLKANPERSNSATAKLVKVDDKTVGAVRADLERRSEIPNVKTRTDTKGRAQPAQKARHPKHRTENHDRSATATRTAATEPAVRDPITPDEELALLREFARFVVGRARVSTDPKDHPEWKTLLGKAKATLGIAP